jgi:hypothetical protein
MVVSASTDHSPDSESASGITLPAGARVLSGPEVLDVLRSGDMVEVHGVMPWSSNYTFLVTVSHDDTRVLAVYKPARGEQPLWDFPHGSLALREVAAYLVSQELGWDFIPPTVLRDGEYGPGAVQLFIDADFEQHYFTLREQPAAVFAYVAAFDVITNNADRKAGHFLKATDGHIWVVDHGLTFHAEPKLRTVVWDFADQPLPETMQADLRRLQATLRDAGSPLATQLARLISPIEIKVFRQRVTQLLRAGRLPLPGPGRCVPFPPV